VPLSVEQAITNPFKQVTSFSELLKQNSITKRNKANLQALKKIGEEDDSPYMISEKLSESISNEGSDDDRSYKIKVDDVNGRKIHSSTNVQSKFNKRKSTGSSEQKQK
jgi:hypothetical protein